MSDAQSTLVYSVDERSRSVRDTVIYSLQWVATMFYGVVWGYAIVGIALGVEGEELLAYMSTIVAVTGVSTFVQAWLGHRFGAVSGPNVIPSLAIASIVAARGPEDAHHIFIAQAIAGIVIVVLALTGAFKLISSFWSPLILGSMILMVGLAIAGQGVELLVSEGLGWPFWVAGALALAGMVLSIRGRGVWGTLSPLLIIAGGYAAFMVGGQIDWDLAGSAPAFTLPQFLPHGIGWPPLDILLIIGLVNLMAALNLYGNLAGYAEIVGEEVSPGRIKRAFTVFGTVETALPGVFGAPATVAYGENLGIVATTRVASRYFLLIGAGVFTLLAVIGPAVGIMSAMPEPVAGAVLLGIASTAIGIGVNIAAGGKSFEAREQAIVGFSVFLALGLSLLPEDLLESLPQAIAVLLENPIITVILFVLFFEQVALRERPDARENRHSDEHDDRDHHDHHDHHDGHDGHDETTESRKERS